MKTVELVYALPDRQFLEVIELTENQTIRDIINASSRLLVEFPELQLDDYKVGIFGVVKPLDYVVEEGDRIEIYRTLTITPTEARRLRAKASQS